MNLLVSAFLKKRVANLQCAKDFGSLDSEFSSSVVVSDTKDVGQWVVWKLDPIAVLIQQLVDSRPNA